LLVDDDPDLIARQVEHTFRAEGVEVAVARTGRDGLQRPKDQAPDVILLDVQMPDLSGRQGDEGGGQHGPPRGLLAQPPHPRLHDRAGAKRAAPTAATSSHGRSSGWRGSAARRMCGPPAVPPALYSVNRRPA
jgi:hypothetical protein